MKACDNCVHFLTSDNPDVPVEPICLLEFHFYNAFNWEWFQPLEYYSQPETRCPHYRDNKTVSWPAANRQ